MPFASKAPCGGPVDTGARGLVRPLSRLSSQLPDLLPALAGLRAPGRCPSIPGLPRWPTGHSRHPIHVWSRDLLECDEAREGLVDVCASFVADGQSTEAVEPSVDILVLRLSKDRPPNGDDCSAAIWMIGRIASPEMLPGCCVVASSEMFPTDARLGRRRWGGY